MSTGHSGTLKRSGQLRQPKGGPSVSGGKVVDHWLKNFDAKQAALSTRQDALLRRLENGKLADSGKFLKK